MSKFLYIISIICLCLLVAILISLISFKPLSINIVRNFLEEKYIFIPKLEEPQINILNNTGTNVIFYKIQVITIETQIWMKAETPEEIGREISSSDNGQTWGTQIYYGSPYVTRIQIKENKPINIICWNYHGGYGCGEQISMSNNKWFYGHYGKDVFWIEQPINYALVTNKTIGEIVLKDLKRLKNNPYLGKND